MALSLQSWSVPDQERESLNYLIARINEQKGSFRQVTEESLEREIREAASNNVATDQAIDKLDSSIDDADERLDDIYKSREEVIKNVQQAHNESATALEFISLLLSRHAPAAASLTMSPFLKQSVPLGALGAETVKTTKNSDHDKQSSIRDRDEVSVGWRLESLTTTANCLLKSAKRLEEEMVRETAYWDSIVSVKNEGWSICRMPQEAHTLAVRYGCAEAHADFRNRGLAALRRESDGHLCLDRGLRVATYQRIRIRYLQRGVPIASSSSSSSNGPTQIADGGPIASQILNARNSIFDEELHLEMHREAQTMLNRDVRCRNNAILIPYKAGRQIELDLIDMHEPSVLPHASFQDDSLIPPNDLVLLLRLLLSAAHRRKLSDRSKVPQPLRGTPSPRPIYAILTPIVDCLSTGGSLMSAFAVLSKHTSL